MDLCWMGHSPNYGASGGSRHEGGEAGGGGTVGRIEEFQVCKRRELLALLSVFSSLSHLYC